jgi:hypothetical protein
MTRLLIALALPLWLVPAANAMLTPAPRDTAASRQNLFKEMAKDTSVPEKEKDLVITERTEVKLDGRECKYEEVPDGADIVLLEVASDKKAIIKIHFQTKK